MIPSPKTSNRSSFKSGGLNIQPKPKIFTTVNTKQNTLEAKKVANQIDQTLALGNQGISTNAGDSGSVPKYAGSPQLTDLNLKAPFDLSPKKAKKGLGDIGLSDSNSNSNPITTNPNIATNVSVSVSDTIFPVFRPEILLLSQFKPLYRSHNSFSNDGKLFNQFITELRLNESEANSLLDEKSVKDNNENFKSQLYVLRNNLQSLGNFVSKVSTYQKKLDVSHDVSFNFKIGKFIEKNLSNSGIPTTKNYSNIGDLNFSINLKEALITARGAPTNIQQVEKEAIQKFASSKLFLVALQELRTLMFSFPYQLCSKKSLGINFPGEQSSDISDIYKLPKVRPSRQMMANSRFDVFELTDGITEGIDFTPSGDDRFKKTRDLLSSAVFDGNNAKRTHHNVSLLFYICFKDLIQKTRFELRNKQSSITDRQNYFDSFIGYYRSGQRFDDAATMSDNNFSGDKLSDLAFFGNLEDKNKKVLILEDSDSANISNKVKTGGEYLFAAGNLEDFFTTSTARLQRVKDFKNFLDKLTEMSFDNFIDLGVLPIEDSYVASLGKSYSTLNPLNAFVEFGKNILQAVNDFSAVQINPYTYANNYFVDLDLIGIFCYEQTVTVINGGGATVDFGDQISNWIYNYCYSKATGTEFQEDIGTLIRDLFLACRPSQEGDLEFALTTSVSEYKHIKTTRDGWVTTFNEAIKNSKFISVIIDFFKKYIDLGNLLPVLFYSIRSMIKLITPCSINNINWSSEYLALRLDYSKVVNVDYEGEIFAPEEVFNIVISSESQQGEKVKELLKVAPFNSVYNVAVGLDKATKDKMYRDNIMFNKIATNIDLHSSNSSILTFAILNTIQVLRDNAGAVLEELQNFDQNIVEYLLRYLNGDRSKLSSLFKEQQLALLLTTVEDLYKSYDGFSTENVDKKQLFVKTEDSLPHSTKVVEMMQGFFNNEEFYPKKGYNKQIISVGIPAGLFKNVNTFLKNKKSKNKSDDVFKILIYKIDLLNPYIIYKPKSFLFEASRFPVRVYSELKKVGISYDLIPTRNYSLFSGNEEKFKMGSLGNNMDDSFGDEYKGWSPSLSTHDKEAILSNQTTSFLLENYLRIISGFNVNELTFNNIPLEEMKQAAENAKIIPVEAIKKDEMTSTTLQDINIGSRQYEARIRGLDKAAVKAIPNPDFYISKLLQPKKFDRVINIIFDPEFDLDYDATKTGFINSGFDKVYFDNQYLNQKNAKFINKTSNLKDKLYVDVDKTPEDVEINSYFVAIETHGTYEDINKNIPPPEQLKVPELQNKFLDHTISENRSISINSIAQSLRKAPVANQKIKTV